MRYVSTRGGDTVDLATALGRGLAADGGLFLPETLPPLPSGFWTGADPGSPAAIATRLLAPFVEELSPAELRPLLDEALDFPFPLREIEERISLLELFHGPTLAFKDVGARVLARLLPRLVGSGCAPVTVLVATSGDTGGAVASAFHGVSGTRVVVLYPAAQVSERQERQMATLGDNVTALRVQGTFDDCQRLVKGALADRELAGRLSLTSANSINVGRLLPQMAYYAAAHFAATGDGRRTVYCVPSGNFGNLTAGLMAERLGLPARRFLAATNANDVVPVYLATGRLEPRPSVRTLAHAMDVGDPSNLERIQALFGGDLDALRRRVAASRHGDDEIRAVIRDLDRRRGVVVDPHTAVGVAAARCHLAAEGERVDRVVVLATAHPAKLETVVEPILGRPLPVPERLARALARPLLALDLEPEPEALVAVLDRLPAH